MAAFLSPVVVHIGIDYDNQCRIIESYNKTARTSRVYQHLSCTYIDGLFPVQYGTGYVAVACATLRWALGLATE